jgi:hypothetical protein
MTHYLVLQEPVAPAHRLGATRDDGDTVYLTIDGMIGSVVLANGSAIHTDDYEGRYSIVTELPAPPMVANAPSGARFITVEDSYTFYYGFITEPNDSPCETCERAPAIVFWECGSSSCRECSDCMRDSLKHCETVVLL